MVKRIHFRPAKRSGRTVIVYRGRSANATRVFSYLEQQEESRELRPVGLRSYFTPHLQHSANASSFGSSGKHLATLPVWESLPHYYPRDSTPSPLGHPKTDIADKEERTCCSRVCLCMRSILFVRVAVPSVCAFLALSCTSLSDISCASSSSPFRANSCCASLRAERMHTNVRLRWYTKKMSYKHVTSRNQLIVLKFAMLLYT